MKQIGRETETIEYKRSTSELKEGIISIVAILNKHNGGELYFGIKNDGVAVGQTISDKTLRDVSQAIANHVEPQIFPDISNVKIENKDCIRIAFEGDNVPYYAYGRAYLRVADEDRVMSPQELESYILNKKSNTTDWDSEASDKTVDDVDEKILMDYIAKANAAGRIDYGYTNKTDILTRLNLINGDKITNAAKVMFCSNVNLEIQMATFATNERLTFIDIGCKSGTIIDLVDNAERYIKNTIRWRVEFDGSRERNEIPEVPIEAVREALINSFCHKDYRAAQNNEVVIFKNRIEIYNPGKFPDGYTPQDFIEKAERTIHRNKLLAQILYYSKDIERFGTGLRRIMTACQEADVKVEFQMLKMGFAVVFHRQDVSEIVVDKMGRIIKSKPLSENGVYSADVSGINGGINSGINELRQKIIDLMRDNPKITTKKIAEYLEINIKNAESNIRSLKKAGIIEREGAKKNGCWIIKS
jgi:ATP-dependent DNA helicase RecG